MNEKPMNCRLADGMQKYSVYIHGKANGVLVLKDKYVYMNEKTDGLPACRWIAGKKYIVYMHGMLLT